MAFQTIVPNQLGQAAIGTPVSTLYTVPASTRTFLKDMDICNTTPAPILVSIFIVPSRGPQALERSHVQRSGAG